MAIAAGAAAETLPLGDCGGRGGGNAAVGQYLSGVR